MTTAEDIVKQIGALPPLPGTAMRLISVINEPRSTVEDIVEAIRYDQAITAAVLRLCNSAYFGLSRKVTSLHEAMLCLGTVKVLQMVMSVHTTALLKKEQAGYGLEPGTLWRHSVAVALASAAVTQRLKYPNAGLAFTAGLLHDIGKVVLNEYVGGAFAEIVRRVGDEHLSFQEAESKVLGFSHEEIGAMVAKRWELPESIERCIRYHHTPSELIPPDPLVDTVYLANCVCLIFGVGLGEDGLFYRADEEVMERCGLKEPDLEVIGAQVMIDLRRVEQIFEDADKNVDAPQAVSP